MQGTKSIYKNLLCFYTLIKNYQKEKLRKQSHLLSQQKEYLRIHLTKELKDIYTKNHKTLMKETEEDTNKWNGIPCT